jgi:type II secretory pathway component PulF
MNDFFPTFRRLAQGRTTPRGQSPRPRLFSRWWPWCTNDVQRRSLLRLIGVAVEERLPLAPLLEAWAADERGVHQRRVERLASLLREGSSLPDAVEGVAGVLRDSDVLAIRFGVQSGTLSASLRQALRDDPTPGAASGLRWTLGYAFVLGAAFLVVATFIGLKIVPTLRAIFVDFDLAEPAALRGWARFSSFFVSYWWAFFAAGALAAWSAASARPGRYLRNVVWSKLLSPLRVLRSADVLDKLSIAANAGRPMTGAISTLARYHFDPAMRRKLLFVRNEIEQGADVWQSLVGAGLLTSPEESLLSTSDRIGNRSWILRQVAATKRRRAWRKLERASELLLPVFVIAIGGLVLYQALAVLMPLISLINNLGKY